MGLPRAHRLKHRKDFEAVYRHGGRYADSYLIIRFLSESEGGNSPQSLPTRFGISIGRKVSKKAVIRNRIKRQIRQAIRSLLPAIKGGSRVVILVRPGAVQCNYEHFLRELKQLLLKAEIIDGY